MEYTKKYAIKLEEHRNNLLHKNEELQIALRDLVEAIRNNEYDFVSNDLGNALDKAENLLK